jgi:hypothetical protein
VGNGVFEVGHLHLGVGWPATDLQRTLHNQCCSKAAMAPVGLNFALCDMPRVRGG